MHMSCNQSGGDVQCGPRGAEPWKGLCWAIYSLIVEEDFTGGCHVPDFWILSRLKLGWIGRWDHLHLFPPEEDHGGETWGVRKSSCVRPGCMAGVRKSLGRRKVVSAWACSA